MPKPAQVRPRTFELVVGLSAVVLVAGFVLSRNGPQTSNAADRPVVEPAAVVAPAAATSHASVRIEQRRHERDELAEAPQPWRVGD